MLFRSTWAVQFKLSKYWLPHVNLSKHVPPRPTAPRPFRRHRYRWWQAASYSRWLCTFSAWFLILTVAAILFGLSIPSLRQRLIPTGIPDFWR